LQVNTEAGEQDWSLWEKASLTGTDLSGLQGANLGKVGI
jgi:hypothetical protein